MTHAPAPRLITIFGYWIAALLILLGTAYGVSQDLGFNLATAGERFVYACLAATAVTFAIASFFAISVLDHSFSLAAAERSEKALAFFWNAALLCFVISVLAYMNHRTGYVDLSGLTTWKWFGG